MQNSQVGMVDPFVLANSQMAQAGVQMLVPLQPRQKAKRSFVGLGPTQKGMDFICRLGCLLSRHRNGKHGKCLKFALVAMEVGDFIWFDFYSVCFHKIKSCLGLRLLIFKDASRPVLACFKVLLMVICNKIPTIQHPP
jgi:hypothetical protein